MKSKVEDNKACVLKPDDAAFNGLFQNIPVPMFLLDEGRRISKMTRAAREIFAHSLNAIRELSSNEVNEPQDYAFGRIINCIHSLNDLRGCGFSDFCEECTVKRAVSNIYKTGTALYRQEVKLAVGEKGRDYFLIISATPVDLSSGRKVYYISKT